MAALGGHRGASLERSLCELHDGGRAQAGSLQVPGGDGGGWLRLAKGWLRLVKGCCGWLRVVEVGLGWLTDCLRLVKVG